MISGDVIPFFFRNPVSAGTHLVWCLFAAYCTGILWRLARGDRVRQLSVGCFGLSMTLLYGASGAYHAVPAWAPSLVELCRRIDHSAIYVLIAGTYTPVFAILLQGRLRIWLLGLVWGLAAVGIACKWLLPFPPYPVTVGLYIGMGWLGLLPLYQLIKAIGFVGMGWGLLGGILYTLGGLADAVRWPVLLPGIVGHHEVLHLFDMGGTLVHVFFVLRYILPFRR